jgi:hypothetical protein
MSKIAIARRIEVLSEISRDVAQVFFAAMVVESIVNRTQDVIMIIFGLLLSIVFWVASLLTVENNTVHHKHV